MNIINKLSPNKLLYRINVITTMYAPGYCPYLIMNTETMHGLRGEQAFVVDSDKRNMFCGCPIAIDESLSYGEVDIR